MSITVTGIVTNGGVVPSTPLPEGLRVQIQVQPAVSSAGADRLTSSELRRMPREERQVFLAAAAALAEPDYRDDKELTGFDAFGEEDACRVS